MRATMLGIAFISLLPAVAAAAPSRCDAPPYGATKTEIALFKGLGPLPPNEYMQRACRLKYDHKGDPHSLGLPAVGGMEPTDEQLAYYVATTNVPILANNMWSAAKTAAIAPREMSLRDFIVDGPTLAHAKTHVRIHGVIVLIDDVWLLYPDQQSATAAKNNFKMHPEPPSVPVTIDNAPHDLRDALYYCGHDAYVSTFGCGEEIDGIAETCELSNGFGTLHGVCLDALDGRRYNASRN